MPILWANPATWASTNATASGVRQMVCSAIRRARQVCRSPPMTRAHTLGRRCLSSTAWAIRTRPESVEAPMARANSAMQNSATNGAPGTGQEQAGVSGGAHPGRGLDDRLGWVLLGPGDRTEQDGGLGAVGGATVVTHEPQHTGGAVELLERGRCGGGHGSQFKHRALTETARIPHVEGDSRLSLIRGSVGLATPVG